jgi:hypothetical protein
MPEGAIYVGRPSRWGNGYRVGDIDLGLGRLQTARDVVECFRAEIMGWNHDYRVRWLAPLRGHDLACWCGLCDVHRDGLALGVVCPDCASCHADVLLGLANA